ncbi:MAG: helix-turn-helix domain-containing protein [Oscillatoria sp. PMC 1051.18]|nr:helix-turn-helix domain-containing protein [Oscillatoria sp. PMC 1050.18]MEC5031980.1 helix-turn-helix domain-containing protein [Oscillatoria sp. PMC 1051.18]
MGKQKGKRSLIASITGIKVAKLKLEQRSLTQKHFGEDLQISWSTISKFFNGKPVDRRIFVEICEALDLEWEDIVLHPTIPELETITDAASLPDDLAFVEQSSARARIALNPYILPLIRREALLSRCLDAIFRGVKEKKRRVISILGAAGYGKSTLLGSIYDRLKEDFTTAAAGWVALVRCNDLIESAEMLSWELGEKLSGKRESIVEVTRKLSQSLGRGVLLLDTLDLILEPKLVPIWRCLCIELLENEVTVVFTCRDTDYRDFFSPYPESFAGFFDSVEKQSVKEFDDKEVTEAATAFLQGLGTTDLAGCQAFAAKIIALSADSQSLTEITHNPLLLALLCDLFAKEENVPEDLTVSQLYDIFWDFRISQSRKLYADARRIGIAKKNLCLRLAEIMYSGSSDRLRDFVYETQLELDEIEFQAYSELKSDGVINEIGGERLIFFHQTFVEYAIARWLYSTPTGETAQVELLGFLQLGQTAYTKHYLWSVLRQLLNLVSIGEFFRISRNFNRQQMLPFRTVAFASVSHADNQASSILLELIPIALQLGDAYQNTLLIAIKSASNRHLNSVWSVNLALLSHCDTSLSNKVAETAGELLTRLSNNPGKKIEQALVTIQNRPLSLDAKGNDERSYFFGNLITAYAQTPKTFGKNIDIEVCQTLQQHYYNCGSQTRRVIIQLHLTPDIPPDLQISLFKTIIAQPPHNLFKEKEEALSLFQQVLPRLINSCDTSFGNNWLAALYTPIPGRWEQVLAATVGFEATKNPNLITTLVTNILLGDAQRTGKKLYLEQLALEAAINYGAGELFTTALLQIPCQEIPSSRLPVISVFLRSLVTQSNNLERESRKKIANWLLTQIQQHPKDILIMLNVLEVDKILGEQLEKYLPLLQSKERNFVLKKIKCIPEQIEPYLHSQSHEKEARLALVRLYQAKVENQPQPEIISYLYKFCLDKSREVTLSASDVILNRAENVGLDFAELLTIIEQSPVVGCRFNLGKALIKNCQAGWLINESQLLAICKILSQENTDELIQVFYKIVDIWSDKQQFIPLEVAEMTFAVTERIIKRKTKQYLETYLARPAYITLKMLANLDDPRLINQLANCTRLLFKNSNINRAINSLFVIGLLERINRFLPNFLSEIVREDFLGSEKMLPLTNMDAAIVAIVYSQGKNAPILDEILQGDYPQQLKNHILRERETS